MATDKQQKAMTLLQARVSKLDNQLRLIGNLANKQYYKLTKTQIDALEFYLDTQIKYTINRLRKNAIANFHWGLDNGSLSEFIENAEQENSIDCVDLDIEYEMGNNEG